MRAGVALGSNLGDRLDNVRAARKAIVDLAGVTATAPVLASPIYETEPVDCEPGAAKFVNAVLEFDYKGKPADLLEQLIRIEESLGRGRDHARNVSRKIDIDLLYLGEMKIDTDRLQLPHPRLDSRTFVLQPLADIRPDLVLPNQTESSRDLLLKSTKGPAVVRIAAEW